MFYGNNSGKTIHQFMFSNRVFDNAWLQFVTLGVVFQVSVATPQAERPLEWSIGSAKERICSDTKLASVKISLNTLIRKTPFNASLYEQKWENFHKKWSIHHRNEPQSKWRDSRKLFRWSLFAKQENKDSFSKICRDCDPQFAVWVDYGWDYTYYAVLHNAVIGNSSFVIEGSQNIDKLDHPAFGTIKGIRRDRNEYVFVQINQPQRFLYFLDITNSFRPRRVVFFNKEPFKLQLGSVEKSIGFDFFACKNTLVMMTIDNKAEQQAWEDLMQPNTVTNSSKQREILAQLFGFRNTAVIDEVFEKYLQRGEQRQVTGLFDCVKRQQSRSLCEQIVRFISKSTVITGEETSKKCMENDECSLFDGCELLTGRCRYFLLGGLFRQSAQPGDPTSVRHFAFVTPDQKMVDFPVPMALSLFHLQP